MTHTSTEQPEALRLADICAKKGLFPVEDELRRLHAESEQHLQELAAYRFTVENLRERVAELESQLAASQQGVQPVAWLAEYVDREGNSAWYVSTHKELAVENDRHGTPHPLYTHPTTQGMDR